MNDYLTTKHIEIQGVEQTLPIRFVANHAIG